MFLSKTFLKAALNICKKEVNLKETINLQIPLKNFGLFQATH